MIGRVAARRALGIGLVSLVAMLLLACSGDKGTGPVEVKWDRDACTRCRMVLSDRLHAAEVRGGPAGQRTEVHKFDDFGCAVLWLDDQPWKNDPRTEFWVIDYKTGKWIDAKKATYVEGHNTPMAYGLGAEGDSAGLLNFAQAAERVRQIEQRYNVHGEHLEKSDAARP